MNLATAKRSTGRAGEEAAQFYFRSHGWKMWKVPPDVRVCGQTGRPGVFLAAFKAGGMPDYLGYRPWIDGPLFTACEVKECNTDSMPASRLSKAQREFMSQLPEGTAYTGILWRDGKFEVFPFINKGSYKKRTVSSNLGPVAE